MTGTTRVAVHSLKYHRLHPEYVYTRIRNLQGKYNLRILLTMVDIPNHEDSLRELAKTSLVNNVTIILCWSAAEAARYLELYKSYEHANFSAIRGQQATGYAEKLVEFVTVPRSVNKTDAVALVSTFGSLRHAINADPEQVAIVGGWGEKKVKAWCKVVEQPFRVKKAAKRRVTGRADEAVPIGRVPARDMAARATSGSSKAVPRHQGNTDGDVDGDVIEAMNAAAARSSTTTAQGPKPAAPAASATSSRDEKLSEGIAAALARLRENG